MSLLGIEAVQSSRGRSVFKAGTLFYTFKPLYQGEPSLWMLISYGMLIAAILLHRKCFASHLCSGELADELLMA